MNKCSDLKRKFPRLVHDQVQKVLSLWVSDDDEKTLKDIVRVVSEDDKDGQMIYDLRKVVLEEAKKIKEEESEQKQKRNI